MPQVVDEQGARQAREHQDARRTSVPKRGVMKPDSGHQVASNDRRQCISQVSDDEYCRHDRSAGGRRGKREKRAQDAQHR